MVGRYTERRCPASRRPGREPGAVVVCCFDAPAACGDLFNFRNLGRPRGSKGHLRTHRGSGRSKLQAASESRFEGGCAPPRAARWAFVGRKARRIAFALSRQQLAVGRAQGQVVVNFLARQGSAKSRTRGKRLSESPRVGVRTAGVRLSVLGPTTRTVRLHPFIRFSSRRAAGIRSRDTPGQKARQT